MQVIELENLELKKQVASRADELYRSTHELEAKDKDIEMLQEDHHKQIERQL